MLPYHLAFTCRLRRVTTPTSRFTVSSSSGHGLSQNALLRRTGHALPTLSTTVNAPVTPFAVSLRHKASSIRIANRKKVEMFVGKRYHLPTRLRTAAPDIALEWDHEKNPMHLYPEIVSIGYMSPVHWKCNVCDTSYKMSVEKRVVRGGGCPACEDRELNRSIAHNTSRMEERQDEAMHAAAATPSLLPGEENPALRPKRTPMLNIRTKY